MLFRSSTPQPKHIFKCEGISSPGCGAIGWRSGISTAITLRLRYFCTMKLYREVVRPPLTLMLFLIVMYFSLALAVWAAFDFFQALATFLILLLTLPFIWRAQIMVISVDEELYVDRAHIELNYLREARDRKSTRLNSSH